MLESCHSSYFWVIQFWSCIFFYDSQTESNIHASPPKFPFQTNRDCAKAILYTEWFQHFNIQVLVTTLRLSFRFSILDCYLLAFVKLLIRFLFSPLLLARYCLNRCFVLTFINSQRFLALVSGTRFS